MIEDMVWVSRKEVTDLLRPLADICMEIEACSTLPENSGDDRPMWGFNNMTVTLGQLRAIKRFFDTAAG